VSRTLLSEGCQVSKTGTITDAETNASTSSGHPRKRIGLRESLTNLLPASGDVVLLA
jgi:hypothetical protein